MAKSTETTAGAASVGATAAANAETPKPARYQITPKDGGEAYGADSVHTAHAAAGRGDAVIDTVHNKPFADVQKEAAAAKAAEAAKAKRTARKA